MEKLPFSSIEVFLAIAEHGSLRAAAKALGVGPPAVSHQLKSLEQQVGVTLFARTTRSIQLTDAGRLLLSRGAPAMSDLADVLAEVRGVAKSTKGTLRITLPYGAFRLAVGPRIEAFSSTYPDIEIELSVEEAFVDLVKERHHAGVRLGGSIQEDMIAVRLTPPLRDAYFASSGYLDRYGRPKSPGDLLGHNCIRYRYIQSQKIEPWPFIGPDGAFEAVVSGGLIVNSFEAAMEAARHNIGIAHNFRDEIEPDIASGRMESVLDKYAVQSPGFFLYYPRDYARLEILKLFVEYVKL